MQKILVAHGDRNLADKTLDVAIDLAKKYSAAVIYIASVYSTPRNDWERLANMGGISLNDKDDSFRERTREYVEKKQTEAAEKVSQSGIPYEKLLLEGRAGNMIVEAAKKLDVDLIVIGVHNRVGVERLYVGCTSKYVMQNAPCNVFLVRK